MHHVRSQVDEKSNLNQVLKASTRRGHRSSGLGTRRYLRTDERFFPSKVIFVTLHGSEYVLCY